MKIAGIDLTAFMESVAAKLANLDSGQQAKFLNIFFNELHKACGSDHMTGTQCLYIKDELNETAAEFVSYLVKEENKS